MADDDPLAAIASELGRALQPLAEATTSADSVQSFLLELGWDIALAMAEALHAAASTVYDLVEGGDPGDTIDPTALLSGLRAAYVAISGVASGGGLPAEAVVDLPRQIADFVVSEYLLLNQPRWGHLLRVLGIIRIERVAATATRPEYVSQSVDWEGFGDLVHDPLTFFRTGYGWGTSGFRGEDFIDALADLADAWGIDTDIVHLDPLTLAQLMQGALSPATAVDTVLRLPLVSSQSTESYEVGVGLFLLSETAATKPGFAVMPYVSAGVEAEIGLSETLRLVIGGKNAIKSLWGGQRQPRPDRRGRPGAADDDAQAGGWPPGDPAQGVPGSAGPLDWQQPRPGAPWTWPMPPRGTSRRGSPATRYWSGSPVRRTANGSTLPGRARSGGPATAA
jgi:hypothetical protein